jgi:hypothetical protein
MWPMLTQGTLGLVALVRRPPLTRGVATLPYTCPANCAERRSGRMALCDGLVAN